MGCNQSANPGNIVRQTGQAIENIERLISSENFTRHGLPGAGATLRDIAKLRVYVKHQENYEQCREVCERLLPRAIYLHADICRPDLLMEIEAVTFSPFNANGVLLRRHMDSVKGGVNGTISPHGKTTL